MNSFPIRISTLLAFLLVVTPVSGLLQAQDQGRAGEPGGPVYGPYAHVLLVGHRAGFGRLPGVPNCCREFTGGSGTGFDIGGLVAWPFSERWELEGRLGLVVQSVDMREVEGTTVIIAGVPTSGSFEHQLDASLAGIELHPALVWKPFGRDFRVHLGPAVGFYLSGSFEQREVLIDPESLGTFENNRRIRNEQSGDIPGRAATWFAAQGGVSWELPLNHRRSLTLVPELRYSRGLTDVIPDSSWSTDWISIGASLRFGPSQPPAPPTPIPPPPVAVDTLRVPDDSIVADPFSVSVQARGVDEGGRESEIATLRVEEFISTNMRPLLNYVFFEENGDLLPERYIRLEPGETGGFDVDRLHSVPVIQTYHHVLNIVGERMQEHPEAVVTLTGTNDGAGELASGGRELSARRAQRVRDYLMRVWGIDSARLPIEVRDLPKTPSNTEVQDGIEENRRVELHSETWAILEPVVTVDTLRLTNPPRIRIYPETDMRGPASSWRLTVRQGVSVIREFTSGADGGEPRMPTSIEWNLAEDQRSVPRTDLPVTFELTVTDAGGVSMTSGPDSLDVDQTTVSEKRRERSEDRYIDRYSLILFDFDRAELNRANDTIASFIRGRISPEATVEITGQTDRIGEEEYNLRLSRGRANSTADALGLPRDVAEGEGENVEIYPNDLPEGRFYSRTVRILVETPITGDSSD